MDLYRAENLGENKPRLEERMNEMLTEKFRPFFDFKQQNNLSKLVLEFPPKGQAGNPFEFYAIPKAQQQTIVLPIFSLLFLEDLCTAYAWLWKKNYSLKSIDKYIAMIMVPKGLSQPPLVALQIPNNALQDEHTDSLSLRFRNSAFAFILAHEIGHHYYKHSSSGLSPKQAQQNEIEADRFALRLLSRVPNIPMGAIIWFQAIAYAQPNRGKFASDEKWQEYLDKRGMHPLTPDRLRQVSNSLFEYQNDFARGATNKVNELETIKFISEKVKQIAEILEDPEIQIAMQKRARKMDLNSLTPRPDSDFF